MGCAFPSLCSGKGLPQEVQETIRIAEADPARAEGKRHVIEANVTLRRARTRLEAISAILPSVSN